MGKKQLKVCAYVKVRVSVSVFYVCSFFFTDEYLFRYTDTETHTFTHHWNNFTISKDIFRLQCVNDSIFVRFFNGHRKFRTTTAKKLWKISNKNLIVICQRNGVEFLVFIYLLAFQIPFLIGMSNKKWRKKINILIRIIHIHTYQFTANNCNFVWIVQKKIVLLCFFS